MASELKESDTPSTATRQQRACDKVRIRFCKDGDLRFVSHRDLMRCFERILRRTQLPVHVTQGFHPMPRMVFAMSLGLGIAGLNEVLELEFNEHIEPAEVHQRLTAQMPAGLKVRNVRRIPVRLGAQVRRVGYRCTVPVELAEGLTERIEKLLAAKENWIERTRPAPRRLNIRPFMSELRMTRRSCEVPSSDREPLLEMLLWVTSDGAARPSEVLSLLGLSDFAQSGASLERHILEIYDELEGSQ
jgi:radical SAM-linked protein